MTRNTEIAAHLDVKPHTVGRWRQEEDWDGLKLKIDRRTAEGLVEKIATDRVNLNVRHFRYWELVLAKLAEGLKGDNTYGIREIERMSTILDKAQKGQRLAKGLSVNGETEESIRAKSQAEVRRLIDVFIDSVKENVHDEETRDAIRRSILGSLPQEEDDGAGDTEDAGDQ
jgi:hypothetical protein